MIRSASPQRSALTIIFVTVFTDLLGFGIVLPLLPYYAQQFHASATTAGVLMAVYSAMQFICAPLWGRWSDRIGRRPVILLSLAGSTCSYLLFAFANGIALLFVSRILAGIAGANIPVAQAFIADSTTDKDRARGMGLVGAAFGLGFVFGPLIGGLLARYGHFAPGLAASLICGINVMAAYWRLPESLPPERRRRTQTARHTRWREVSRQPYRLLLLLLFGVVMFSFSTMETTLSLLCATAYGLQPSHIYWLFGYMGVLTTIMQGALIGRLSRRIDETRLLFTGGALLALGLLAAPFTPPVTPLLIALAAIAFGHGMSSPVLSSLLSRSTGSSERGALLGLSQSVGSLARILGPIWGGATFDYGGPASPYITTAALMVLATGVAYTLPSSDIIAETAADLHASLSQN